MASKAIIQLTNVRDLLHKISYHSEDEQVMWPTGEKFHEKQNGGATAHGANNSLISKIP